MCAYYLSQTGQWGDNTCRLPHLTSPRLFLCALASAQQGTQWEEGLCSEPCLPCPNTPAHHTHAHTGTGPWLHSPQAPLAMRGRKWAKETEEKVKDEGEKTPQQCRAEWSLMRRLKEWREIIGLWRAEWILGLDTCTLETTKDIFSDYSSVC